ncbi:MAG: Uncharacterized protein LiPW16_485 [Microgenomates group bacterium LiPW_16]|nr:MAG: Uncharacterized protein LiPW16_485 [Microgenomates group bacterium LiPW_16]
MAAQEQIFISWRSPSRPFKKRQKEFFTTIGAIVFLLAVILVFIKEFLLIGVILALAFVAYVLATVEPEEVEHKITTNGLESARHFYKWEELAGFWFWEKWGQPVLIVVTKLRFPGRVVILIGGQDQEKIKNILSKYLKFYEKPEKNWMDDAAKWLAEKVPLEKS